MAAMRAFLLILIPFWASVCTSSDLARAQVISSTAPTRSIAYSARECRTAQSNCTDMVYPYLQNPQYMFPTSLDHVNDMCKMWSKFVDCIRRYISNCFEESRRVLFHKSVENSIDTVHAICSSKLYQNEYLAKATCFKQVSIDHCGAKYQQLIDIVSNPNANDDHICCYYAQFKDCVNRPLLEECGRKAKNLMDHSMSFLISRCNYYSYQGSTVRECPKPAERKSIVQEEVDSFSESSTITVDNFEVHNKIDPTESSDELARYDSSQEEVSKPRSSEINQATATAHPPPVAPSAEEARPGPDNQIDSIEASESDTRSAEQLIVYTMKPESQVGALGFDGSGSLGIHAVSLLGHLIRLGLVLGWIHWLAN